MYHDIWYALPLIVSVSLVYSATRYESMPDILYGGCRVAAWFAGFVGIVMGLVYAVSAWAY